MTRSKVLSPLSKGVYLVVVVALVLSLAVVVFTPPQAVEAASVTYNVVPYTLATAGTGSTAAWSTADKHTGSSSVKLTTTFAGDYAAVGMAYNSTINSITSLSFWYKDIVYNSGSGPRMSLSLSKLGSNYLAVTGCAVMNSTWKKANAITGVKNTDWNTTGTGTQIWWYGTWNGADLSSYAQIGGPISFSSLKALPLLTGANVLGVTVYMGVVGSGVGTGSAYIDDLEVNLVTYYGSIQDACDTASYAGIVNVAAGTYDEQVVINRAITLQGAGDATIVQPSSEYKLTRVFNGTSPDGTKQIAGVIVANALTPTGVTVKNLKVNTTLIASNATAFDWLAGIFYRETGGVIDTVSVVGGGEWCRPDVDEGFGIYLSAGTVNATTSSVEVKSSIITNYDKDGIDAHGSRLAVNIHHNIVTGRGVLTDGDEVQNGIVVGDGATGTVNNNIISNMAYTTEEEEECGIGILFDGSSGSANNNIITDCQMGVLFQSCNGTAQGNTVNGGAVGLVGLGTWCDAAGAWRASFVNNTVSAAHDLLPDWENAAICALTWNESASLSVTIDRNQLINSDGTTTADGICIGALPEFAYGDIVATITNNVISGWEHGIYLLSSLAAGSTITGNTITNNVVADSGIHIGGAVDADNVAVHYNNIVGNQGYGIYNGNTTHTLDAEHNWWGDPAGPSHPGGGGGAGDMVSDYVDYNPWLDAPYPGGVDRSFNVMLLMPLPVMLNTTSVDYDAIGTPYSGTINSITSLSFQYRHNYYDDFCGPRMSLSLVNVTSGRHYLAVTGCAVNSTGVWKTADAINGVKNTDWYTTGNGTRIWWYGTWDGTDPDSYNQTGGPISFSALKTTLSGARVLDVGVYMGIVDGVGPGSADVKDLEINGMAYGIPAETFESIQDAIDNAGDGDTLEVLPGKYNESLDVYWDGLTIRSRAGAAETTIDILYYYGIDIYADDVTIEGFTITGFDEGIALDADECTITQNIITGNEYGINIDEGDGNTIEHNTIANNGCGVYIYYGDDNSIINNTIENNEEGVLIYGGEGNGIEYNTIRHNEGLFCGIDVESGADNYAHYNNIEGNKPCGVCNYDSEEFNATLNWWGDATGPSHSPGTGDAVSDNVTYSPWLDAPYPDGAPRYYNVVNLADPETLIYDTIQDAIDGASSGDTLMVLPGKYQEEYLEVNVTGLTICSAAGAAVTIIDDTYSTTGINITADSVTIQGFTITKFVTGILINGADGCTITENIIEYNVDGIVIDGGNDTAIVYNTIRHNEEGDCGIEVEYGDGNYAHYNNIEGNWAGVYNYYYYNPYEFNATLNWWGDPTGPYNASTNPSATGDAVSDNVDYTPWLNGPYPNGGERYYNVNNPSEGSYNNIQGAINNAFAGETLVVLPGKYHESLDVWKANLTIRSSAGATRTIIDGFLSAGVFIDADNVTIQGFTICNFVGDGIYVGGDYCTIANNIIKNNWCGIYTDGNHNTIADNIISGNHEGWGAMTISSTTNLNGVWGSGANDVFAVGDGGTILHYTASGWSTMSSGTTKNLNGVWGRDWDDVYAVGDGGTILHYNGMSWSAMESGTSNDLNGVSGFWGVPDYLVVAVGDSGTIIGYDGISWSPMYSVTSEDLNGVSFIFWYDGLAVGDNGTILCPDYYPWGTFWWWPTTDSGTTSDLNGGCWAFYNYYGFVVVGDNGTILYYDWVNDIWVPMDSGTARNLNGIWGDIWDGGELFVVGDGGTILYNNGVDDDWEPMVSSTTSNLNGVWGSGWNDVFAVGDGGIILHYNGMDSGAETGGIYLTENGDSNTIRGNNIIDNGCGIYIDGGDSNTIEYNIIRNNIMLDSGVHVAANSTGNALHWNKIVGNGPVGVYNDPSNPTLNATYNWWGHQTGPYNAASNPKGLGDAVSSKVTFSPYLIGDYEDLSHGTRLYITSDKRFRFTGTGYDSGIVSDTRMVVRGDGRVDINYRSRDGNGYSIVFTCTSNSVGDSCQGTLSGRMPVTYKVFTIYDPAGVEW